MLGSDGDDELVGTTAAEVLCGKAGNDRLIGGGGLDVLVGGAGDDVLVGGDLGDVLAAGPGDDSLFGGGGADELNGDAGVDDLNGASGDDLLRGGEGADQLAGSLGDDELDGGVGIDSVGGGPGADRETGTGPSDDNCTEVEVRSTCATFVERSPTEIVSVTNAGTGVRVEASVFAGYGAPEITITAASPDSDAEYVAGPTVEVELLNRRLEVATIFLPVDASIPLEDVGAYYQDRFGRWVEQTEESAEVESPHGIRVTTSHFSKWGTFRRAGAVLSTRLPAVVKPSIGMCLAEAFGSEVGVAIVTDSSGSVASWPSSLQPSALFADLAENMVSDNLTVNGLAPSFDGELEDEVENEAFGPSRAAPSLLEAINSLDDFGVRVVVLVTDGSTDDAAAQLAEVVDLANARKTIVAVYVPARGNLSAPLQNLVVASGGFTNLSPSMSGRSVAEWLSGALFDPGTDTDGDLLSDCEETMGVDAYHASKSPPFGLVSTGFGRYSHDAATGVSKFKTDPTEPDTDRDGIDDGIELLPASGDPRTLERSIQTLRPVRFLASNPGLPDSDGDRFSDAMEFQADKDPMWKDQPLEFDSFLSEAELNSIARSNASIGDRLTAARLDAAIKKLEGSLASEVQSASRGAKVAYLSLLAMNSLDGAHKNFDKAAGFWDEVAGALDAVTPGDLLPDIPRTTFLAEFWGDQANAAYRNERFKATPLWFLDDLFPAATDVNRAIGWTSASVAIGQTLMIAVATAGLGGWVLSTVKGGQLVQLFASPGFVLASRVVVTLSISCFLADIATDRECPPELVSVLNAADLVISAGQASRTFGTISKITSSAKRIGNVTLRRTAAGVTAEVSEVALDGHFQDNLARLDDALDPVDDLGSALRRGTTSAGEVVDTPSFSATKRASDVLVSLGRQSVQRMSAAVGRTRLVQSCVGSFSPATEVVLADGSSVSISSLVVGDRVATLDPFGRLAVGRVTDVSVSAAHDRLGVELVSGEVVETTANHRFLTPDGWKPAGGLQAGDALVGSGGGDRGGIVRRLLERVNTGRVHDISVSPDRNFFVRLRSGGSVLAHNATACTRALRIELSALRAVRSSPAVISAKSLKYAPHRWGAMVEEIMHRVYTAPRAQSFSTSTSALAGKAMETIMRPVNVVRRGPDGIYLRSIPDPNSPGSSIYELFVVDAKAKGFLSKSRFRANQLRLNRKVANCAPTATGPRGSWCGAIVDAISRLSVTDPVLAANATKALNRPGGVLGEFFKWKLGAGYVS